MRQLNKLEKAHFYAQCNHESMGFKKVYENLNYSAEGLLKTFPKYFTKETALKCARNPEMIGNIVYGQRMGNSGEGYKYRGRGYLHLTGKYNYEAFSKWIGDDCVSNPDLVATKYQLESAMWFFDVNNLWVICNKGNTPAIVAELTKKVNGGYNGLKERQELFKKYYNEI